MNGNAILCVGQGTKSDFMLKIIGSQLQWELANDKILEKLDTLIEEWLNKEEFKLIMSLYKIFDC